MTPKEKLDEIHRLGVRLPDWVEQAIEDHDKMLRLLRGEQVGVRAVNTAGWKMIVGRSEE